MYKMIANSKYLVDSVNTEHINTMCIQTYDYAFTSM